MNEKQLAALVRKNQLKAAKAAQKPSKYQDPTLDATRNPATDDLTGDAQKIFKEMKKREF